MGNIQDLLLKLIERNLSDKSLQSSCSDICKNICMIHVKDENLSSFTFTFFFIQFKAYANKEKITFVTSQFRIRENEHNRIIITNEIFRYLSYWNSNILHSTRHELRRFPRRRFFNYYFIDFFLFQFIEWKFMFFQLTEFNKRPTIKIEFHFFYVYLQFVPLHCRRFTILPHSWPPFLGSK